jgi:hypothetical protein|tara:strand:- start:2898 stop:3164 length:267 start_codon:yes stop_codon:yes gene_type:complete
MEEIPDYVNTFITTNKEQLDNIYKEHIEKNFGILNINIDNDNNKVDVFFVNEVQLIERYGKEYVDNIKDEKFYQLYDKKSNKMFILKI